MYHLYDNNNNNIYYIAMFYPLRYEIFFFNFCKKNVYNKIFEQFDQNIDVITGATQYLKRILQDYDFDIVYERLGNG